MQQLQKWWPERGKYIRIKRLFENNFHNRKVTFVFLIKKKVRESFEFHSNVHTTKYS